MSDAIEMLPYVPRGVARALGLKWYFPNLECPNGHVSKRSLSNQECRGCVDLKRQQQRLSGPEIVRAKDRAKYHRNLERERSLQRASYRRHTDKRLIYEKQRYAANPDIRTLVKQRARQWAKVNRGKTVYFVAQRRAWIKQATPPWLTRAQKREIRQFYIDASCRPGEWHVDHVYPLRAKNSCGLNVPWNLQILPAAENVAKGNKNPTEWP